MHKKRLSFWFFSLGILIILSSFFINYQYTLSQKELVTKTEDCISKKVIKTQKSLQLIKEIFTTEERESLINLYEKEKIGIYIFQKDSLKFWNNAQIPFKEKPDEFIKDLGFVKLNHGYYLYAKLTKNTTTFLGLCLIKPIYEIQNNYLTNNFSDWLNLPNNIDIDQSSKSLYQIKYLNTTLFSLKISELFYPKSWVEDFCFLIFFCGFLIILLSFILILKQVEGKYLFVLAISFLLIVRFVMIRYHWPDFNYNSVFYDFNTFINNHSYFNAFLGDVLLNAFVSLFISIVIYFYLNRLIQNKIGQLFLLGLINLCILYQFNNTLVSLGSNTDLNFDLLNILNLKLPVFIGLTSILAYSTGLFILIRKTLKLFDGQFVSDAAWFVFMNLLICFILQIISNSQNYFENYWLLLFSSVFFCLKKLKHHNLAFGLVINIFLISLISSIILNTYISKNYNQELNVLSIKLSEKTDATLEREFKDVIIKIHLDQSLNNLLSILPNSEKELEQLLKQKYFAGYFNRYDVYFSLFDENCHPLLPVKQAVFLNEGFFQDQIVYQSDSTVVKGLFFVKNYQRNSRYIGKININDKKLYVLFEPKQIAEIGSFHDLLLDQSQQKQQKLKNLSYAIYRAGEKVKQFGEFNFPYSTTDSLAITNSNKIFLFHFIKPNQSTEIIICQKIKTWTHHFTYNSYLFLFFSFATYLLYFIYSILFTKYFETSSLTRRIQIAIVLLLILAMSAVSYTSAKQLIRQSEADNKKQLREKTEIIINELSNQFEASVLFDNSQYELVNLKLKEYARFFNTDISLFDKYGVLFNTSQPKLYELGLASNLANPYAYWNLKVRQLSSINVDEKAGTLTYLSSYSPVFNTKNDLLGFINLPYFAKQSDLTNDLSQIISALINVYVILFVMSILAGLILSGYITKPLRLIKNQIASISLGKQNEKINWQSNDEIGRLVFEYNLMISKLEESVNLLAQGEREIAWREMAKQVAHEINNPLTPMKLNLQYLQQLMLHHPEDFKIKFEKSIQGIIDQIDSLSAIAGEFSNFAKLPATQIQNVNLLEIIEASVLLFANTKRIIIQNKIKERTIFVKGDKDQCLRIFNNVLKNAIESVEGQNNPKIELNATLHSNHVIIQIADNGAGISEELKPNIFKPNFTTKTSGTGLGLAIVKSSIQGFDGNVWFESKLGLGSTFYLEFKIVNK